jgi:protein-L-isoaspartate(D-aspartate) O-methyltransferase
MPTKNVAANARLVAASAEVTEARIIAAFATVRREQFIGPGRWQIAVAGGYMSSETDDPRVLYQDIVVGLAPERRINNGEPSLHAKCLGLALPQAGETAVHVGAGTGYYTAILAHLVGRAGHVHAYEIGQEEHLMSSLLRRVLRAETWLDRDRALGGHEIRMHRRGEGASAT